MMYGGSTNNDNKSKGIGQQQQQYQLQLQHHQLLQDQQLHQQLQQDQLRPPVSNSGGVPDRGYVYDYRSGSGSFRGPTTSQTIVESYAPKNKIHQTIGSVAQQEDYRSRTSVQSSKRPRPSLLGGSNLAREKFDQDSAGDQDSGGPPSGMSSIVLGSSGGPIPLHVQRHLGVGGGGGVGPQAILGNATYTTLSGLVTTMSAVRPSPMTIEGQGLSEQVYKRPRLAVAPLHSIGGAELAVDTNIGIKKTATYSPQVEAISPTLPSGDACSEELRHSKEELVTNINKVDREIGVCEANLTKLRKNYEQMEEEAKADKPIEGKELLSDGVTDVKHETLAQKIYSENRKKASQSHNSYDSYGTQHRGSLPLYHEPRDSKLIRETAEKFLNLKKVMIQALIRRKQREKQQLDYMSEKYDRQSALWAKKMERRENSSKRKAKEAKMREIFEKTFPELKKQREEKEKGQRIASSSNSRVTGYVRSEANVDEIIDGLHEQELVEQKTRSLAVLIPLQTLDLPRPVPQFRNENGFIPSPNVLHEEALMRNNYFWTDAEKEIFAEKYISQPKKFGVIASFISTKTPQDCCLFYYMSKKGANYKQSVRRHNVTKRKRYRATQAVKEEKEKEDAQEAAAAAAVAAATAEGLSASTSAASIKLIKEESQTMASNKTSDKKENTPMALETSNEISSSLMEVDDERAPTKKEASSLADDRTQPPSSGVNTDICDTAVERSAESATDDEKSAMELSGTVSGMTVSDLQESNSVVQTTAISEGLVTAPVDSTAEPVTAGAGGAIGSSTEGGTSSDVNESSNVGHQKHGQTTSSSLRKEDESFLMRGDLPGAGQKSKPACGTSLGQAGSLPNQMTPPDLQRDSQGHTGGQFSSTVEREHAVYERNSLADSVRALHRIDSPSGRTGSPLSRRVASPKTTASPSTPRRISPCLRAASPSSRRTTDIPQPIRRHISPSAKCVVSPSGEGGTGGSPLSQHSDNDSSATMSADECPQHEDTTSGDLGGSDRIRGKEWQEGVRRDGISVGKGTYDSSLPPRLDAIASRYGPAGGSAHEGYHRSHDVGHEHHRDSPGGPRGQNHRHSGGAAVVGGNVSSLISVTLGQEMMKQEERRHTPTSGALDGLSNIVPSSIIGMRHDLPRGIVEPTTRPPIGAAPAKLSPPQQQYMARLSPHVGGEEQRYTSPAAAAYERRHGFAPDQQGNSSRQCYSPIPGYSLPPAQIGKVHGGLAGIPASPQQQLARPSPGVAYTPQAEDLTCQRPASSSADKTKESSRSSIVSSHTSRDIDPAAYLLTAPMPPPPAAHSHHTGTAGSVAASTGVASRAEVEHASSSLYGLAAVASEFGNLDAKTAKQFMIERGYGTASLSAPPAVMKGTQINGVPSQWPGVSSGPGHSLAAQFHAAGVGGPGAGLSSSLNLPPAPAGGSITHGTSLNHDYVGQPLHALMMKITGRNDPQRPEITPSPPLNKPGLASYHQATSSSKEGYQYPLAIVSVAGNRGGGTPSRSAVASLPPLQQQHPEYVSASHNVLVHDFLTAQQMHAAPPGKDGAPQSASEWSPKKQQLQLVQQQQQQLQQQIQQHQAFQQQQQQLQHLVAQQQRCQQQQQPLAQLDPQQLIKQLRSVEQQLSQEQQHHQLSKALKERQQMEQQQINRNIKIQSSTPPSSGLNWPGSVSAARNKSSTPPVHSHQLPPSTGVSGRIGLITDLDIAHGSAGSHRPLAQARPWAETEHPDQRGGSSQYGGASREPNYITAMCREQALHTGKMPNRDLLGQNPDLNRYATVHPRTPVSSSGGIGHPASPLSAVHTGPNMGIGRADEMRGNSGMANAVRADQSESEQHHRQLGVTAANLIEAIIFHQINKNEFEGDPVGTTGAGGCNDIGTSDGGDRERVTVSGNILGKLAMIDEDHAGIIRGRVHGETHGSDALRSLNQTVDVTREADKTGSNPYSRSSPGIQRAERTGGSSQYSVVASDSLHAFSELPRPQPTGYITVPGSRGSVIQGGGAWNSAQEDSGYGSTGHAPKSKIVRPAGGGGGVATLATSPNQRTITLGEHIDAIIDHDIARGVDSPDNTEVHSVGVKSTPPSDSSGPADTTPGADAQRRSQLSPRYSRDAPVERDNYYNGAEDSNHPRFHRPPISDAPRSEWLQHPGAGGNRFQSDKYYAPLRPNQTPPAVSSTSTSGGGAQTIVERLAQRIVHSAPVSSAGVSGSSVSSAADTQIYSRVAQPLVASGVGHGADSLTSPDDDSNRHRGATSPRSFNKKMKMAKEHEKQQSSYGGSDGGQNSLSSSSTGAPTSFFTGPGRSPGAPSAQGQSPVAAAPGSGRSPGAQARSPATQHDSLPPRLARENVLDVSAGSDFSRGSVFAVDFVSSQHSVSPACSPRQSSSSVGGGDRPLSSIAASHQTVTSLLSARSNVRLDRGPVTGSIDVGQTTAAGSASESCQRNLSTISPTSDDGSALDREARSRQIARIGIGTNIRPWKTVSAPEKQATDEGADVPRSAVLVANLHSGNPSLSSGFSLTKDLDVPSDVHHRTEIQNFGETSSSDASGSAASIRSSAADSTALFSADSGTLKRLHPPSSASDSCNWKKRRVSAATYEIDSETSSKPLILSHQDGELFRKDTDEPGLKGDAIAEHLVVSNASNVARGDSQSFEEKESTSKEQSRFQSRNSGSTSLESKLTVGGVQASIESNRVEEKSAQWRGHGTLWTPAKMSSEPILPAKVTLPSVDVTHEKVLHEKDRSNIEKELPAPAVALFQEPTATAPTVDIFDNETSSPASLECGAVDRELGNEGAVIGDRILERALAIACIRGDVYERGSTPYSEMVEKDCSTSSNMPNWESSRGGIEADIPHPSRREGNCSDEWVQHSHQMNEENITVSDALEIETALAIASIGGEVLQPSLTSSSNEHLDGARFTSTVVESSVGFECIGTNSVNISGRNISEMGESTYSVSADVMGQSTVCYTTAASSRRDDEMRETTSNISTIVPSEECPLSGSETAERGTEMEVCSVSDSGDTISCAEPVHVDESVNAVSMDVQSADATLNNTVDEGKSVEASGSDPNISSLSSKTITVADVESDSCSPAMMSDGTT